MTVPALRPADPADVETIAAIWHAGWREAHLGRVPDELVRHRHLSDFLAQVPVRLDDLTVATVDGRVVGFVMVHDDEIEHLYVDGAARGTGVADALIAHAEAVIGGRFDTAWLAVVDDNARARRFYERCGWSDHGPFDNPAWTPSGVPVPVPTRRYEKRLTASAQPG